MTKPPKTKPPAKKTPQAKPPAKPVPAKATPGKAGSGKAIPMKEVVGDAVRHLRESGLAPTLDYLQQLAKAKDARAIPMLDRLTVLATAVQQADPKNALGLIEKAIELSPEAMEAWVLAGALQDRLGDRKAAEAMAKNDPESTGERGVLISTASVAAYDGQIGQAA